MSILQNMNDVRWRGHSPLTWITVAIAIGMFLVLALGSLVTNTGSAYGCGHDWPLCNGKFVPAYSISSFIEYGHRMVSGLVGILVVVSTVGVTSHFRARKDAMWYAWGTFFFTFLQAALGALAVVWTQSSAVLALHFGISLLALAFSFLQALLLWHLDDGGGKGFLSAAFRKDRDQVSAGFRWLVWFTMFYSYVVVYSGAYVRHTKSMSGCQGWPLCNGKVIPDLSGATGIAFGHRVAALLLGILIVWVAYTARKRYSHVSSLQTAGKWSLILVVLQIFSGAYVVATLNSDWFILSAIIHAALIGILFSVLSYLSIYVYQSQKS